MATAQLEIGPKLSSDHAPINVMLLSCLQGRAIDMLDSALRESQQPRYIVRRLVVQEPDQHPCLEGCEDIDVFIWDATPLADNLKKLLEIGTNLSIRLVFRPLIVILSDEVSTETIYEIAKAGLEDFIVVDSSLGRRSLAMRIINAIARSDRMCDFLNAAAS